MVRVINYSGRKCLKTLFFGIEFSFVLEYDKIALGVDNMQVQTGYIYHIKDDFFECAVHGIYLGGESPLYA